MARKSRKNQNILIQKPENIIYKAGLYARLSVEDFRKKESDSIGTQMSLLRQFASGQPDIRIIREYEDADKTGTNFNRADFNLMLHDIKSGKINCIIVKDLSRFGRNYIETGDYLERIFPLLGVRFISAADNYDSLYTSNDESLTIPLKNIINEYYARDISKKIRSQYEMKRKRGEFCGSVAPYGYIKKGNSLIVDEEKSKTVKRIFSLAARGYGDAKIAEILNSEGIFPPAKHRGSRKWYKSAVRRITVNTAYLGRLEQGKYMTDFMSGGRIKLPPDKRVIVKNTHLPIIDEKIFEAVKIIKQRHKNERKNRIVHETVK